METPRRAHLDDQTQFESEELVSDIHGTPLAKKVS